MNKHLDRQHELSADVIELTSRWENTALAAWSATLEESVADGLSLARYGDLPRWREALAALPQLTPDSITLNKAAVGCTGSASESEQQQLKDALKGLHPWRKGPFDLFDVLIDTEWRSDWKWERLLPGLRPLAGKRVLDVGCGSGYHCWRMLGAGAAEVIGIDPTPLFVLQFKALQHYLQAPDIFVLPLGIEQVPPGLKAFDTAFSMGILYHRRSPFDHLLALRDALCAGGQLILETLIVDGDENTVLTPPGRYARMGNVWCLPSVATLLGWLKKTGFRQAELIDCTATSIDEQRSTEWMTFHSLAQFLDPANPDLTVEGHPAPKRAIITAEAP
jgi:tRNA (mo5U34)-methyltransferase